MLNVFKLVLLPGMDGTGGLFADFTAALPDIEVEIVQYPVDRCQSNAELLQLLEASLPVSTPFVLVAESFSTPLAMQWAATDRPNLKALVVCAGFATSPLQGLLRWIGQWLSPVLFLIRTPRFVIRHLLAGRDAPASLIAAIENAIRSVKSEVLVHRLRMTLTCDARSALKKVNVPILFLQPTQDRLVSSACLEEMQSIKPDAAVEHIPGPHLLLQTRPRAAAETITAFIRQC